MLYQMKKGVFHRDGQELFCPFRQPIPTASPLGKVSFIQHPCGSHCALFHIDKIKKNVELMCSTSGFFTEYTDLIDPKEN